LDLRSAPLTHRTPYGRPQMRQRQRQRQEYTVASLTDLETQQNQQAGDGCGRGQVRPNGKSTRNTTVDSESKDKQEAGELFGGPFGCVGRLGDLWGKTRILRDSILKFGRPVKQMKGVKIRITATMMADTK